MGKQTLYYTLLQGLNGDNGRAVLSEVELPMTDVWRSEVNGCGVPHQSTAIAKRKENGGDLSEVEEKRKEDPALRPLTTTSNASNICSCLEDCNAGIIVDYRAWWNMVEMANRSEVIPCRFMHLINPYSPSYFDIDSAGLFNGRDTSASTSLRGFVDILRPAHLANTIWSCR